MMDATSLFIGIVVTAAAVPTRYRSKAVTYAIFPLRDPVFLAILALELVVLIAGTSDG